MTEATSHHYIPALGKVYDAVNEYAEPILRIVLGGVLIPHGMQKLFGAFGGMGFAGNAALFDRIGYTPGIFWGTLVGCTELIGGIMLVLGLFTRFAAAAVVIIHPFVFEGLLTPLISFSTVRSNPEEFERGDDDIR